MPSGGACPDAKSIPVGWILLGATLLASVRCGGAPSPKEQAEALMNSGLPSAQKRLAGQGDFDPFGAAMNANGQIEPIDPSSGSEQPASLDFIDILEQGFRKRAESGEYRATAIFANVRVQPPDSAERTEAIEVILEHAEGYCVNVFFPYSRAEDGQVTYRAPFVVPRDGSVFTKCGQADKDGT